MIRIMPQLALFLENRPGMLSRTCQALAAAKINILAMSIIDIVDHAIIRLVLDKPKEGEQVLAKLQIMMQRGDVVYMDVPNTDGVLAGITEKLAQAGINLEYAYCTAASSHSEGALVLRTNDLEATINALS